MKTKNSPEAPIGSEPRRKLSLFRLILAIIIIAGIASSSTYGVRTWKDNSPAKSFEPWFAAYVDVTSKPTYAFEQVGTAPTSDIVLSFIVASTSDRCQPTWGTYYTMEEAAQVLNLDRRIARLQQQGGKIAVSFGGALNDELALACTDPDTLLKAYTSVVDRYQLDTIDLDLEQRSLNDGDAAKRRASAIAQLQSLRRKSDKNLAVWLTLPVTGQGLTPEGTNAVSQMLSAGVDLAGINIMTMDYGGSLKPGQTVLEASEQAAIETHRQLGILYKQAGINLTSGTLWGKIGLTPMIGQNDVREEVFTISDAKDLNVFSHKHGIGRMSMWSANRDIPCGENYVDQKVVSDSCSGVKTEKYLFAKTLSEGFTGNLTQNSGIVTKSENETSVQITDNPDESPYQIWQETGVYPKGVKVVWHGNVYEAKWWTKNDLPDNPVLQSWETPWQLMGPVLPGEKPIKQPTLPKGTYPAWSGTVEYEGGQRVLFEGIPFQAKWWNQGESPAASTVDLDNSPWLPLTQAQILQILDTLK